VLYLRCQFMTRSRQKCFQPPLAIMTLNTDTIHEAARKDIHVGNTACCSMIVIGCLLFVRLFCDSASVAEVVCFVISGVKYMS
jgi:hypothetical protein